jgi:hypothetical protein
MTRTYILVDFENVQPSAADIRLVQGADQHLWIFRGPGQKKYSADVAEAWQPLGERLKFVPCAKAGRNAVDMHIALEIGRLIGDPAVGAAAKNPLRFVVVSKDTDFEPVLLYVREKLGLAASRATSLKAAIGSAEKSDAKAAKARPAAARKAAKKTPAAKKASKETAAKKVAAKAPPAPPPPPSGLTEAKHKVVDSLRRMGEKRPGKRKGLERHIESHLGRKLAPGTVSDIVAGLERDGVLKFTDKKVEYSLPKPKS